MIKTLTLFSAAFVVVLPVGSPALAQFQSENTSLHAWLNLAELGGASSGNDCWGYTSPSGREYALMGIRNALVVVEITDPGNPEIIGSVSHANTSWGDVKTYSHYAYVVNDNGGGGMDVIDLSDVDNGNVTLIQRVTAGGLSTSHNVAIDTDSGYLYLAGSNLNGDSGRLVAFSLSDPEDPTFAGQVASGVGSYVHDAQIVTFESGPNAGKQIAFCANGGTGLDIYDVTNKSNMFRLSRTTYPNLSYAHQCWLSEDRQYVYLNDETDSVNETVIFDVSNLSKPQVVGSINSGVGATDHNLYVHNGFIFEAEYHAGLRIFCADDPLNPVQVGWFDSYPENDNGGFDGAWSVYPFFPSGTVLISDITRGLFIVDPSAALLECGGPSETIFPDTLTIIRGLQTEGDVQDLFTSDDFYVVVQPAALVNEPGPPVQVEVEGTAPLDNPSELRFRYEGHVSVVPIELEILLFNYDTQEYDSMDVRIAATSDEVVTVVISDDPGRYIEAGTGKTRTLMTIISLTFEEYLLAVAHFDQTIWTISP